jgi:uncharacterized damage-inducible protein DinB
VVIDIAAVEWSWIFEDIDGKEMKFEEWKYAFPLRPSVNLPQQVQKGKEYYLDKLEEVRDLVYQRLCLLSDKDLLKLIKVNNSLASIEWILYHLIEHEAEHLGQMKLLNRLYQIK